MSIDADDVELNNNNNNLVELWLFVRNSNLSVLCVFKNACNFLLNR